MSATSILGKNLYDIRETTGDVRFIVGSESVFAHRLVLAAVSPKYHAQFYGGHPDHGDIHVHDISAPAFIEFIKFLYLEETDFTLDNISEILNIAKQCLVEHLVAKCGEFLMEEALGPNLLQVYRLAKFYSIEPVLDVCQSVIRRIDVLNSEEFLDCDHDTLLQILDIGQPDCMETLKGCVSWARESCSRKNLDESNMKNIRKELGNAIYQIPFWLLTVREFVSCYKSHEGLLTKDEFIEITCMIGDPHFESEKFEKKILTHVVHDSELTLVSPPSSSEEENESDDDDEYEDNLMNDGEIST